MSKLKIIQPQHDIIEKTALELAATFYEIGRSQGLSSKCKDARQYARKNLERFIPKALEYLISMLGRKDIPQEQKDIIYDAIIERANDPKVAGLKQRADGKRYYDGSYKTDNPFLKAN